MINRTCMHRSMHITPSDFKKWKPVWIRCLKTKPKGCGKWKSLTNGNISGWESFQMHTWISAGASIKQATGRRLAWGAPAASPGERIRRSRAPTESQRRPSVRRHCTCHMGRNQSLLIKSSKTINMQRWSCRQERFWERLCFSTNYQISFTKSSTLEGTVFTSHKQNPVLTNKKDQRNKYRLFMPYTRKVTASENEFLVRRSSRRRTRKSFTLSLD